MFLTAYQRLHESSIGLFYIPVLSLCRSVPLSLLVSFFFPLSTGVNSPSLSEPED